MTATHRTTPSAVTSAAVAPSASMTMGPGYRFTVLTDRLLRMEWSDDESFVDRPTQLVQCRSFPTPEFSIIDEPESLEIWTEFLHLQYDKGPFRPGGLSVRLRRPIRADHRTTWRYEAAATGDDGNLGGTARTLDDIDGRCELGPGLFSTNGYAIVDDGSSATILDDGWVEPRSASQTDLYLFGYGNDYRDGLRDYFHLSGRSPLLPRFALGNWWSRFHPYTADEYLGLMDRFSEEAIPFSVAMVDMDWHLVAIDPEIGNGWTGYTWNTELFPDPRSFLAALHDRGLAVSLNVHPADGVRRHEVAYPDVARDLDIDPDTGREIPFDITSRDFVSSYLTRLHHPQEDDGVDFWWLDWQSGTTTRMAGLDPLWMLNHVHYHDAARRGSRPLILSRYAGFGSHRYPIGFSGDTLATWASLEFQPEFTATAANVGYYWWSHDIGGHTGGGRDDELAARWYQFGVFSPICRLHSSPSPFNSKEPWRFDERTSKIMARYLRLRHRLVPYLYSAMWVSHHEGIGPVRPMYHDHPRDPQAYAVPNQYMFGPDLLVAPITEPADPATHLARSPGWLPPGAWYDFFTGDPYEGDREVTFHRTVKDIPVLARAGAVIPLALDPLTLDARLGEATESDGIDLRIFPGTSPRSCVLYEDDGTANPSPDQVQRTSIDVRWQEHGDGAMKAVLTIAPPNGPSVVADRRLFVTIVGVEGIEHATCNRGASSQAPLDISRVDEGVRIDLGIVELEHGLTLTTVVSRRRPSASARVFELLDQAEISFALKDHVMRVVDELDGDARTATLHGIAIPDILYGALLEILASEAA